MALEPGGYADKIGNRYEGRWVVRQLLRLLTEDLQSVQCEPVGDEERGVDLWVERPDGVRVAQQCKIRNGSYHIWTVADLKRRGILSAMKEHLDRDDQTEFELVTSVPFPVLHDVCKSARRSTGDPESFYKDQIQAVGEDRRKVFRQFCESVELDSEATSDRATAYSYLRRLFVELWPDTVTTREDLLDQARMLVVGDPSVVVAVLADMATDRMRQIIDASTVWEFLQSHDLHPRRLPQDARILPAILDLQQRFMDSISPDLIGGKLIPREETEIVLEALKSRTIVAVHGNPGQGKSGVLYELAERMRAKNITFLPIRLDRQVPKNNPQQFGLDLGLPESPVACLHAVAKQRPCVLILDQLDALRWTSRHSLNALEVCKALVREVRGHRALGVNISVVLACRTYDLENDPEIKRWIASEKARDASVAEVQVGPLKPEAIDKAAKACGQDVSSLSKRQKQILESPQHFAMWLKIVAANGAFEFRNRVQLMREYWNDRIRDMRSHGVAELGARNVLDSIIAFMEQHSVLIAPQSIVSDIESLDALRATGVLRASQGQISFTHQSYLDYQIASRVVREIHTAGKSIVSWLGPCAKQSLFRREQLRQALSLLGDESPAEFLATVRELLDSAEVRFHLKHLCLEVVGQIEAPGDELASFLISLMRDEDWKEHVVATVFRGHAVFVRQLIDRGEIAKWLRLDEQRDAALWLLRSVAEMIPDEVTKVVRPYADIDDRWRERVLACLAWNVEDDSDSMFALRLQLARDGVCREYVAWNHLAVDRRLHLLEAVLKSSSPESFRDHHRGSRHKSRAEHWSDADIAALSEAVREDPDRAWAMMSAQIGRLAVRSDDDTGTLSNWLDSDREDSRQGMPGLPFGLTSLAREAGRILARRDGGVFWANTSSLRNHDSPVIQNLLTSVYEAMSASQADNTIEWLIAEPARFSLGTGQYEPKWMPARRLVAALSTNCSREMFEQLENAIHAYHSPTEMRDAEYWLATWKRGYFGDYWGQCRTPRR